MKEAFMFFLGAGVWTTACSSMLSSSPWELYPVEAGYVKNGNGLENGSEEDLRLQRARHFFASRRYAEGVYETLMSTSTGPERDHFWGWKEALAGRYESALESWEKAGHRGFEASWLAGGWLLLELGRVEDARSWFHRCGIWGQIGEVAALGKDPEAAKLCEKLCSDNATFHLKDEELLAFKSEALHVCGWFWPQRHWTTR